MAESWAKTRDRHTQSLPRHVAEQGAGAGGGAGGAHPEKDHSESSTGFYETVCGTNSLVTAEITMTEDSQPRSWHLAQGAVAPLGGRDGLSLCFLLLSGHAELASHLLLDV